MEFKNVLFFIVVLTVLSFIINLQEVDAVKNIILSPTSGMKGSSVSITGSGFSASTNVVHSTTGSANGVFGIMEAQQYTGLTSANTITQATIDVSSSGTTSPQTVSETSSGGGTTAGQGTILAQQYIADNNAKINNLQLDIISNGTQSQSQLHAFTGYSMGMVAILQVQQFTGLPTDANGASVDSVQVDISSGTGTIFAAIYNDTGNKPSNLLGTASYSVTSAGVQTIPFTQAIPSSGKIWVGFAELSGNVMFVCTDTQQYSSTYVSFNGVFPDPFGTGSIIETPYAGITYHDNPTPHVKITLYNDNGANKPSSLVAQSASLPLGDAGINTYNLNNMNTPLLNGTFWIGIQTDSSSVELNAQSAQEFNSVYVENNDIDNPPNPFGTATASSETWEKLSFTDPSTFSVKVLLYNDNGANEPSSLVAQSILQNFTTGTTGLVNIPISAKIPSNGTLWLAFQESQTQVRLVSENTQSFGSVYVSNKNIDTVPNPFGTGSIIATTYSALSYMANPITTKFDSSILNTIPSIITTDSSGAFSGVTFNVPSSANPNPHTVNASDATGFATASFTIKTDNVSFRMLLNDNSTIISNGRAIESQNGISQTVTTNGTSWINFIGLSGGLYNFTFFDNANNFAVYKLINYNISGNLSRTIQTWEIPFNCVSPNIGYQSDFIIQNNDTDGHHITAVTPPKCINTNELKYNVTFTANGQSNNNYNSLTRITMGTSIFTANPSSFKINGTSISTITTTGVNMLTDPYIVGTGLQNITLDYDILMTKSGSTVGGSGSGTGQLYVTNNSTCFAGVFNPLTNSCQFGLVGFNVTAPIITINPTNTSSTTINLQCSGAQYLTINNVNLGSNPLGLQIYGLPTNVNCGNQPTSCPIGTTLSNNQCVGSPVCPVSSQLSNGVCVGALSCPSGTTLQNGQCVAPSTCSNGALPVGGTCPTNGNITVIVPPNANGTNQCSTSNLQLCLSNGNSCSLENPLACFTSSSQTEPASITATTPNGQVITAKTLITAIQSPMLGTVSLIFILLIVGAISSGIVYRYYAKPRKGKPRKSRGNGSKIEKYNAELRKK